jgi:repressor LexA
MTRDKRDLRNEVLRFVADYLETNGYPPTYDEIMEAVGLSSKSHVDYYLEALEEAGRIERKPRTPRGLRLVEAPVSTFEVPLKGYVAAGRPIEVIQGLERDIMLTRDIADPRKTLFALEVAGDSMVDALVGDGDIVIVEPQQEVARGQMAVVHLLDRHEATLKHVFPEGERVRLQPAHPTLPAFYENAANVEIQGRVVAIVRRV